MANPILKAIDRLIKAGFPENTAKKIASGELPMDFESRMARAREQGYDTNVDWFHGTPYAQSIADKGFDPSRLGMGNDQMGAGFYFSDNPYQASGYATNLQATSLPEATPGIIPVLLKTQNPNRIDIDAPAGFGIELTEDMATEIMKKSPNIRSDDGPLSNFIEPSAIDGYTDADIRSVAKMYAGRDADILLGDIFPKQGSDFLKGLNEVTGIDSVMTRSARPDDPTVATIFDPSQARSRNAAFDPDNIGKPNILGSAASVAAGGILAALGMAPEEAEAGVFPYAFKMAENALERGSPLFTEKALKSAARDASGNSRTAITMMSPDEFLRVVPTPENSISQKNIDKIAEHIRSGGKLDDVPFLIVKMDDEMKMPRYSGHEGRHRALALKQLGIEEMPVRIKMGDNMGVRWDELHSKNPLRNKSLPDFVLHEEGSAASQFPIKKTATGFETARSAAPIAAGGILGALGLPENATAADIVMAGKEAPKEQARAETQQMILDALLGFMAPTPLGDATMDAYNRNRIR